MSCVRLVAHVSIVFLSRLDVSSSALFFTCFPNKWNVVFWWVFSYASVRKHKKIHKNQLCFFGIIFLLLKHYSIDTPAITLSLLYICLFFYDYPSSSSVLFLPLYSIYMYIMYYIPLCRRLLKKEIRVFDLLLIF